MTVVSLRRRTTTQPIRALVAGSSLSGLADALAGEGCSVTLICSPGETAAVGGDRRVRRLAADSGVAGSAASVASAVRRMDSEQPYDLVVLDKAVTSATQAVAGLRDRLWLALDDDDAELADSDAQPLRGLVDACRYLVCPSEAVRERIEGLLPQTLGRCALPDQVGPLLQRAYPPSRPAASTATRPLRVVVAGHDLKFFQPLRQYLAGLPGVELREDLWRSINTAGDEEHSRDCVAWADVVICEWAGANAVWYARHKRTDQRLIVRLHRVELTTDHPADLDIDAVDAVVCISDRYAALAAAQTGWPAGKIHHIPNVVDVLAFDREKLPGAEFRLGMLGVLPKLKRLDLALDVISALRRDDPRFTLAVKSRMPWEASWVWQVPAERAHYVAAFSRVRTDPSLRGGVVFDEPGADVPAWLRGVGFVLSTSDSESFHLAPAEGMASRAVPVVRPWEGADGIYDPRWISRGPAEMAARIRTLVHEGGWKAEGNLAREQVTERYSLQRVGEQWAQLVVDGWYESRAGESQRSAGVA